MCSNIKLLYQGDSYDDEDSAGSESLIQDLDLDPDRLSHLPDDLVESPPQQDSHTTNTPDSTATPESDGIDKVEAWYTNNRVLL